MDTTEDLSARVLLKHIMNVEPPRTPLTRSATAKSASPRRSRRLTKNVAGGQTPQSILRRSLKNKIQESISRKSLPSTRRTASTLLKKANTPASVSVLFDDGETPRHLLKNILLTEPVKSPVVNEQVESEDQQPKVPSANSSLQSRRPSIELSELELTDVTVGNIASTVKGLSRKRPRRSLNVTAFEKRLKEGNEIVEEDEESLDDHSSLSISSSASLSLKTPFADVRTEKKGLQRKVSNRRKISEEEFGAAVNKRQMGNYDAPEQGLSETAYSEGFTLGLSKLSEPDITTDIVHCNTELYAQSEGIMANASTIATQDKPTVMASQIQRHMEQQLDQPHSFPMEDNSLIDPQDQLQKPANDDPTTTSQSDDPAEAADDIQPETENEADAQANDEGAATSYKGESEPSQQKAPVESLGLEEDCIDSQTNIDDYDEVEGDEDEGGDGDDDDDKEVVGEEDVVESDDEEEADEEMGEGETDGAAMVSDEDDVEGEEEEVAGDKDEEMANSEHIIRRAQHSEGQLLMPIQTTDGDLFNTTKTGYLETEFEEENAGDMHNDMDVQNDEISQHNFGTSEINRSPTHTVASDEEAEPDADEENDENDPPGDVEQEEQSEEEEDDDDFQSKTPAFVKQKRIFLYSHPQASSSSQQNIQPSETSTNVPAATPKQKTQRKPRTTKSDPGLPKSYLMNVFKHFAKTKVSSDVYPVLKEIMDKFFDRLAKDLEAYALHARRSTIDVADCELLLRRQGLVNEKVPVEVLIEKYLRLDQRKLLIPIATSGNVVFPKKR